MSRASREIGDTGERHQHYSSGEEIRRSPIRFLPASQSDWTISMPKELADHANRSKKHGVELRYELAILWRRYANYGEFPVSMRLLDELYTAHFRKTLKAILDDTATPVRTHSGYADSARSRSYKFNFRRPKKAPTYNTIPDGPSDPPLLLPNLIRTTIPAAWLWVRYERWFAICERNGWTTNLDFDGRTDWGRPLFNALESALIPETAETERLTKRGIVKCAVRKRGRCYHPLTNLRKDLRRAMLFDGEPTVEVDIGSCYTALLISRLPEGAAKNWAIKAVQSDWYKQFDGAYTEWFHSQCKAGRGYIDDEDRWMLRLDDDPTHDVQASIKIEFQRQCLFWRDGRDSSNPLRVALRKLHPELCRMIESWRQRMTPTELSDVLTRAEGSLVVDYATAELERASITALSNHDGLIVRVTQANEAREILLDVCRWHLGFSPKVSIKATITAAM
ncbi:MAG: hypothetical protein IT422_22580 [Pirellulaceae bacterium]|nr:hypothetical protein [Pirellulaceae bacterium]